MGGIYSLGRPFAGRGRRVVSACGPTGSGSIRVHQCERPAPGMGPAFHGHAGVGKATPGRACWGYGVWIPSALADSSASVLSLAVPPVPVTGSWWHW